MCALGNEDRQRSLLKFNIEINSSEFKEQNGLGKFMENLRIV